MSGIILTLVYTYFYTDRKTADIFKYFDDSKIMFDAAWSNPYDFARMFFGIRSGDPDLFSYYSKMVAWDDSDMMYNDNRIMIRFNCLMRFISFGNYYVHMVVMCFITFYGLTCLFKLFAAEIKSKYFGIFCAVFFMPSVVFWGSAVLKDGVILFAAGMFLYNFNLLLNNSAYLRNKIFFVLGFIMMMFIKVYVLFIMIPGLIMLFIVKRRPHWSLNKFRYWLGIYLIYGISIFLLKFFSSINVVELISLKQHQFISLAIATGSGSVIEMPELSNLQSIIYNLPHALFVALCKPFLFDSSSPLIIMAGFENLLILAFIIFSFFKMKKNNFYQTPWFFFSVFFVVILFSLIGLIVPVAGALVRYKTIALPFLIIAALISLNNDRVNNLLAKWKLKF
jgi:hypothetical protein